jgi:hypothetical protein
MAFVVTRNLTQPLKIIFDAIVNHILLGRLLIKSTNKLVFLFILSVFCTIIMFEKRSTKYRDQMLHRKD